MRNEWVKIGVEISNGLNFKEREKIAMTRGRESERRGTLLFCFFFSNFWPKKTKNKKDGRDNTLGHHIPDDHQPNTRPKGR
jgi:hypothetical protein